ncbi:MAG: D-alanine--D-alanine ligase [Gemmataceae bacterium]|nr:D-alanine--D-alanine ligase [Gemmataceae bacterium]
MKIAICCNLKESSHSSTRDLEEEFDSPQTVEAITQVLRSLGHEVAFLAEGAELPSRLVECRPDFVFNFAEGRGCSRSREARVPGLLEIMGIPYTFSDPFTLCVTLDKEVAKKIVASAGVSLPKGQLIDPCGDLSELKKQSWAFPLIAKPAWEGSSKGIRDASVVDDFAQLQKIINQLGRIYSQPVLVEEFIEGREITVGLIGNGHPEVIGAMEIIPLADEPRFVYSLDVKRDFLNRVKYQAPALLDKKVERALFDQALKAFTALGCKDLARIDFRLDALSRPFFIEANPLPGLNPVTSDLCFLAKGMGWTYERLISRIFMESAKRHNLAV